MPEDQTPRIVLTPQSVLQGASPLVLTATLKSVAGDRFQPAGFPEIGHVIYKAPRKNGDIEHICIVDSPASMANHLEAVCLRGPHDLELDDDLAGMPYLRCVTGDLIDEKKLPPDKRELVVTSLTEGHRIASTYFLEKKSLTSCSELASEKFSKILEGEFGIKLPDNKKAHPPAEKWWDVFRAIFRYDPNALVHGVLFPQYQIKIARFLTAHLEAFGAARVDRSGVKFDRLGKTTSGQPIFAVDDVTASEIRATFILDVALLRSFGRTEKIDGSGEEKVRGLSEKQKEFLSALALWKIDRLLHAPFRYRSGCHLELISLKHGEQDAQLDAKMKDALEEAAFRAEDDQAPIVTDIYWPHDELYREGDREDT